MEGNTMEKKIFERNKITGISYAFTENGIELPVLDITHPLFLKSINEEELDKMIKEIRQKGEERAESFSKIPAFIKNFMAKRSYIMAGFMLKDTDDTFLSGMSTLMMKFGPGLIGKGGGKFFDRLGSKALGAILLRMRVRDICKLHTDILETQLMKEKNKNLCFINIAGGAACDSINAIIMVHKKDPSLLKNREIEISVFDIDRFGPSFAKNCVESLKSHGNYFSGLNISFNHMYYNWNDTTILKDFLLKRKEWLTIASSEGGLFEYATDEDIIRNLNVLHDNSQNNMKIVGSAIRDVNTVDPGIIASMKLTNIKARLLGTEGLKKTLNETNWAIENMMENNPRYLTFTLGKIK
jgi:hypothetical protein